MTRFGMYKSIIETFGSNSYKAKMFHSAMKQEDIPRHTLEKLYNSIMKTKQGS